MLKENYFNRFKELPEHIKQFSGLTILVVVVLLSFFVLNNMFGEGDELVKKMKLEEERIAQEKKLSELISKLPSGILVTFDGTDYYKLTKRTLELSKLFCNGKVVSILEGGYDLNALKESTEAHVNALLEFN